MGGSFSEAAEIYTEDYVTVYENAAEMDINSTTTNAPELGETLKKLEIGQVGVAKSSYGTHIIKRVSLNPENFDKNEKTVSTIYAALVNQKYLDLLEEQTGRVCVSEEILSAFSLTEAVLP
jgi:parvulin-like peptidyl-prolyl isomerase